MNSDNWVWTKLRQHTLPLICWVKAWEAMLCRVKWSGTSNIKWSMEGLVWLVTGLLKYRGRRKVQDGYGQATAGFVGHMDRIFKQRGRDVYQLLTDSWGYAMDEWTYLYSCQPSEILLKISLLCLWPVTGVRSVGWRCQRWGLSKVCFSGIHKTASPFLIKLLKIKWISAFPPNIKLWLDRPTWLAKICHMWNRADCFCNDRDFVHFVIRLCSSHRFEVAVLSKLHPEFPYVCVFE